MGDLKWREVVYEEMKALRKNVLRISFLIHIGILFFFPSLFNFLIRL